MTPMSEPLALVIAIALLLGNAFFVGAEFALVAARRTRIEPKADAGSARARSTLAAMRQVSLMMAGAQLGITLCTLGLGAVGEPAVAHLLEPLLHALSVPESWLHPVALVVATLVVVAFHVVVGEMVPKNIALAGPETSALLLGPLLARLVRVLRPAITALNAMANATLRVFGVTPQEEVSTAATGEDVAELVDEARREGLMDAEEHARVAHSLEFSQAHARDVMIRAASVATIPSGATAKDVERMAAATGHSRFPVVAEDGAWRRYAHLKDALESTDPDAPLERLRPLPCVDAEMPLIDVLEAMRDGSTHVLAVSDTDGTVAGLVLLDDVLAALLPPRAPARVP
jgi:CBS domain containing-hemolysin-like protein